MATGPVLLQTARRLHLSSHQPTTPPPTHRVCAPQCPSVSCRGCDVQQRQEQQREV
ncbi:hypothetical protein E2C01_038135 [Portunus trituberculatus]|uniref:Uncharacterized protein n=1 Tax=Portunus trituberculatus TaxID=210409 RepID=A0A5B7FDD0_PORTR|nr:hypothetical protein [Portunus trituberculatus]